MERQKRTTLAPLHRVAKTLLPKLDISQQNVAYYASLAHYYTVYDLRRLKQFLETGEVPTPALRRADAESAAPDTA